LIDADLPCSKGEVVLRHGHKVVDVRDVGLRKADDLTIAQYAQQEGLCIVTGDTGFGDIRNYKPSEYAGIVVLSLPESANADYINQLLDGFLRQAELVEKLPNRLAIIELGRVRFREE
jgi:predicted nuclease of predicted toxin-antitoxin system